jgi:hypothetical protein
MCWSLCFVNVLAALRSDLERCRLPPVAPVDPGSTQVDRSPKAPINVKILQDTPYPRNGLPDFYFCARFFPNRFSAHIFFILSDSAFRPAAVNPRFLAAFFVGPFFPAAFFAAQYFRIAAIWRCRPSADMLRFLAFGGLPRRLAAGWLSPDTPRRASIALSMAVRWRSSWEMMLVRSVTRPV